MEAKQVKDLLEAYSSIYEKKEEPEMEEGEEKESEKDEGGKHKEGKHKKGKEEPGEKVTEKEGKEKEGKETEKEMKEGVSYSAKKARAGEDIGKPGKMFGKIAKEAGERYGSEERGKKVAGAVLAKLRKEETELEEDAAYDRNRRRAAQRAQARNEARARGQTGSVPGVGYVSPRPERATYTDSAGVVRHHTGARMPKKEDQKESYDLFDYILEHLVAEGYADTNKAALAIMANMSEEWKQSIMEGPGGMMMSAASQDKGQLIQNKPTSQSSAGPSVTQQRLTRRPQPIIK
jgi:hypothetical protein